MAGTRDCSWQLFNPTRWMGTILREMDEIHATSVGLGLGSREDGE
jgi:hypothetical protein